MKDFKSHVVLGTSLMVRRVQVQSPVRELRSHIPWNVAKKKKKKKFVFVLYLNRNSVN